MKIRNGFVSNSSSSSFVCNVSGEVLAGYDGEYGEKTARCNCGHEFLEKYLLSPPKKKEEKIVNEKKKLLLEFYDDDKTKIKLIKNANDNLINELYDENEEEIAEFFFDDEYPKTQCPICQLKEIPDKIILSYLLKKQYGSDDNKAKNEVRKIIKAEFKTLDDLVKWNKGK